MTIETDKIQHFLGGLVLGALGFALASALGWSEPVAVGIAFAAAVGFLKEVVDAYSEDGFVEALDVVATIAGGLVSAGILGLIFGGGE